MRQPVQGELLKLENIPRYIVTSVGISTQYELAARSLHITLRDLVISDCMRVSTPQHNLMDLGIFKNLQDLTFVTIRQNNFFRIHKLIKDNNTVKLRSLCVRYLDARCMQTPYRAPHELSPSMVFVMGIYRR